MDKIMQSNAATAEESAGAAEELTAQATTVQTSVHHLEGLVRGETQRSKPAARKPSQETSRRTFHTGSEFSRIAAEEIQPVQAGQGSLGSS